MSKPSVFIDSLQGAMLGSQMSSGLKGFRTYAGLANAVFPAVVTASLFQKDAPTLEGYLKSILLIMLATLVSKLLIEGKSSWPKLKTYGGARALGEL